MGKDYYVFTMSSESDVLYVGTKNDPRRRVHQRCLTDRRFCCVISTGAVWRRYRHGPWLD